MKLTLPEIVAVGIYDSELAVKNKNIEVTKNRKTTMFEIELPVEKGGISYIDSDKMYINTDMLICAKPGQIRHTKLPFKCYYIHIIVPEGELCDNLMSVPCYVTTGLYEEYCELFVKLCKYYGSAVATDEIIVHSIVLEIIHKIVNDSKKQELRKGIKGDNCKIIEDVIEHINENLTCDLSLESVASFAGFSPVYFHNCFKAATGKTLHKYVEEQRIKKAANMLVTTRNTLAEIAYDCGFSSQSYFSYAFKREMQLTPKEYAKKVFSQFEAL